MHDSVVVIGEDPKVIVGGGVHVSPLGMDVEGDRLMVPVNPFCVVSVMVWLIEPPLLPVTVTGVEGWMVKSTMWNSMVGVV